MHGGATRSDPRAARAPSEARQHAAHGLPRAEAARAPTASRLRARAESTDDPPGAPRRRDARDRSPGGLRRANGAEVETALRRQPDAGGARRRAPLGSPAARSEVGALPPHPARV